MPPSLPGDSCQPDITVPPSSASSSSSLRCDMLSCGWFDVKDTARSTLLFLASWCSKMSICFLLFIGFFFMLVLLPLNVCTYLLFVFLTHQHSKAVAVNRFWGCRILQVQFPDLNWQQKNPVTSKITESWGLVMCIVRKWTGFQSRCF